MDKRWKLREMEKPMSARTGQHVLLHPLVAAILAARGFENEADVRSFLSPLLSQKLGINHFR